MYEAFQKLDSFSIVGLNARTKGYDVSKFNIAQLSAKTLLSIRTVRGWFSFSNGSGNIIKSSAVNQIPAFYDAKRSDQLRMYAAIMMQGGFYTDRRIDVTGDNTKQTIIDSDSIAEGAEIALQLIEISYESFLGNMWSRIYFENPLEGNWNVVCEYINKQDDEGSEVLYERTNERAEVAQQRDELAEDSE